MDPLSKPIEQQGSPQVSARTRWRCTDSDEYLRRLECDKEFADIIGLPEEYVESALTLLRGLRELSTRGEPTVLDFDSGLTYFTDRASFYWDWIVAGRNFGTIDFLVRGWSEGKLSCLCKNSPGLHFELQPA